MKKFSRIISVVLIVVLCMTSLSFASTVKTSSNENTQATATAAAATLIRLGGNYQLWNGVPSSFGNLTWSQWATHSSAIDAVTPLSVVSGSVSLIKSGAAGPWGFIGAALLTNDLNNLMSEAFFQNVVSNCTGTKTAYARVYESYAQSASGTLQYSKVYIRYYTNSNYNISCGTTNTVCIYAWPTGSRVAE